MKITLLYTILLVFALSSCNINSDSDFSSSKQSNFSSNEEKEYVEGRQIFDVFEKVACPVSFEANGFPTDFFQYHDGGYYTFANSFNLPAVNCSLYLADVNCDGNAEICYLNQKGSDVRYQTIIYDYKNGNVLANEEFEHWKGIHIFHFSMKN